MARAGERAKEIAILLDLLERSHRLVLASLDKAERELAETRAHFAAKTLKNGCHCEP